MAPTPSRGGGARRTVRRTALLWRLRPFGSLWRADFDDNVLVQGIVWLPGSGQVVARRGARLLGWRVPIELRAHSGGRLVIGEGAVIEGGVSIEATRFVHVGAGAHIGAFCKILDNHFHSTAGDRGERPEPLPVIIGEGAVIGPRAVLLPGTVLGPRSRVAPGQVVSLRRVLAGTEVGGPAEADRVVAAPQEVVA